MESTMPENFTRELDYKTDYVIISMAQVFFEQTLMKISEKDLLNFEKYNVYPIDFLNYINKREDINDDLKKFIQAVIDLKAHQKGLNTTEELMDETKMLELINESINNGQIFSYTEDLTKITSRA